MSAEFQTLFNIMVGIAGVLGGFILSAVWSGLKDLQASDTKLAEKVSNIEVVIAGTYVKRVELDGKVDALFRKLDHIEAKLDGKLDEKMDKTACINFGNHRGG